MKIVLLIIRKEVHPYLLQVIAPKVKLKERPVRSKE